MTELLETMQQQLHEYEDFTTSTPKDVSDWALWAERFYWLVIAAHNELACKDKCKCAKHTN